MPIPRPEPQDARVIAHVDMDCFYVQVEQRKQPELRGVPTAVVQYNSWKGGGLIAVGYEARKYGVKRSMRGDEAKKACPDIQLIQVPVARGKANLNLYRDAGSEVVSILATKGRCERASIDEVYLDLTDAAESMLLETPEVFDSIDEEALKSHVLGLAPDGNDSGKNVREWFHKCDSDHRDKLLACGAIIVAQLRTKVLEETTFTCSAGIAHNKMLAKLASAMHKPAQQTIVPSSSIKDLLASLPVKKMKQLGGKLGSSLQSDLGVNTVGDLLQFTEEKLQEHYGGNTGTWLWNTARGISGEEVEGRLLPKSHGCGKTFPGPQALRAIDSVEHWLNQLCEELSERIQSDLEKNKRIAHTLTLHARASKVNDLEPHRKFPSRSCPLRYGTMKIQEDAMRLFESGLREFLDSQNTGWTITSLSVGASKILETPHGTCSILKFFHGQTSSLSSNADNMFAENDVQMGSSDTSGITPGRKEKQRGFDLEEVDCDYKLSHQAKTLKRTVQSAAKPKDKGTSSILRFFPSSNSSCSSSQPESTRFVQDKAPELSGHDRVPKSDQTETKSCKFEEDRKGDSFSVSHTSLTQGCTPWAFNIDDIDPSVIDELPLEIQKEVRGWLHPKKPVNAVKRVSSIAQYFSSTKNSQENGDLR